MSLILNHQMCITINVSSNNCNVVKKNIKDHKIADQMLCVCYNLSGAFLLECQTSARKYVIVKVVGTLKTYIFNILYMDVFIANKSDILKKMCFFIVISTKELLWHVKMLVRKLLLFCV